MKILAIGSKADTELLKNKLGDKHEYTFVEDASLALNYFEDQDIVFDFLIADYPDNFDAYHDLDSLVFLNVPKISLAELHYYHPDAKCTMIGFNGLPGFFENEKWEISILDDDHLIELRKAMDELEQTYFVVKDRVGLVAPRVIAMIINEAFYTVQEGTATPEDIDLGMKLGTAYPYGPFEWLEKIGVANVYELLEALYEDTKEERYKIAPLLKRKYLMETA